MLKLKHIFLGVFCATSSLLPITGLSDEITPEIQEFRVQNQFVQNDVTALLLKGSLKQATITQYSIPIEEAHSLQDPDLQDYLSFSMEVLFDKLGFSNNVVMKMYVARELSLTMYRQAEPYHNNERRITSVMLYGHDADDKAAFYDAILNRNFFVTRQSWEENRGIIRINLATESDRDLLEESEQKVIIEEFDKSQRRISSKADYASTESLETYRYVTFEEYQNLDLNKVDATIIEVTIAPVDIVDFSIDDFRNLDSRVILIVSEDLDSAGNAKIEWRYNSQNVTKTYFDLTYYE